MTLYCPGCNAAIDDSEALGMRQMHCPDCGIKFLVPDGPAAAAAQWGEVTTSKMAVIALVAGIGSLILPLCLCPFFLIGVGTATGAAGARNVRVTTTTTTAPPPPPAVATAVPATPKATPPGAPGSIDEEIIEEEEAPPASSGEKPKK